MASFEEKIAAGFAAAGERMDGMDSENEVLKQSINDFTRDVSKDICELKKRSRQLKYGVPGDNEPYSRFWQSEEHAKQFGDLILHVLGRKALTEVGQSEGAALVPIELSTRIIQMMGQYGKFRQNATLVTMGSSSQLVPMMTADLTIYVPGENAEITASDAGIGQVSLVPRKLACLIAISNELDEDSLIGIGEIVATSMARSMAKTEDLIGFLGDGTSTYFGMNGIAGKLRAVNATIGNIKGLYVGTGNAYSELVLEDFEGVVSLLPDEADAGAKWYVHRKFFFSVMHRLARVAGAADMFTIMSGQKARYYLGYPVEFVSCMPSTAANSQICAILGDLSLGAYLAQRRALTLARSNDVYFKNDQLAIRATQRIDINTFGVGDTTSAGPICGLITAAS